MPKASVTEPGGGERMLAVLGPGSIVGELSMITECRAQLKEVIDGKPRA